MTLTDLFDLSLVGRRDQPALEADRTYTFGELDAQAARMAAALAARGVKPGDRVCLWLRNSPQFILIYLAVARIGAVLVPMNVLYRERELRHLIADADPVAVVASEADVGAIPDIAPVWAVEPLEADAERRAPVGGVSAADADGAALIMYTSGTTGRPKGAVLTHNMLAINALNLVACWQMSAADRFFLALPLSHLHGLGVGIHVWLVSGCLMRLEERFAHERAEAQMLSFMPTLVFGVPTMYVRMLQYHPESARTIGGRMRLFVSGSAPLPAQISQDFADRFGHRILERYGMSETLILTSNPYVGERRPGSVGRPLPGVSVRKVDADNHAIPDEVPGVLQVRGPSVFREYWRNAEATRAAFQDGWFKTGDLAVLDPDGYVSLVGRASDLIISGGFNIYPREVEEFLETQAGVAEAAVAGVADPVRGEVPVAYIVPGEGWDAARLERACREQLASFKVPREFVVVRELPRTSLGKVQKDRLAQLKSR
jgi:malonyl-CoA/methylmalonyl-CoA synthetase